MNSIPVNPAPINTPRQRLAYLPWLLFAFGAGLVTHLQARHLPPFIAQYFPDTLWALWVFLCIACAFPQLSVLHITVYALLFSYLTEATQLYHAPWIDAIRATTVGHLVLGDTFHTIDLLCYTLGIFSGTTIDAALCRRLRQPKEKLFL